MDPIALREQAEFETSPLFGEAPGNEVDDPGDGIDRARVLTSIRKDIKRANEYFKSNIEQRLIEYYEIYYSDKDRYRRMFPRLSAKSSIVAFDAMSVIDGLLPNLLRAFFGSERIINISGSESEDADRAELIMELIQWQLTTKNPGYLEFKAWFADALITNLGIIKCYWKQDIEQVPGQEVFNAQELIGFIQDPNVEVLNIEPAPPTLDQIMTGEPSVNVEFIQNQIIVNQPIIESIRPSDIRYVPDGRTLGECSMVAHRKLVSIDHLRREAERGIYNPAEVEDIALNNARNTYTPTEIEQQLNDAAKDSYQANANTDEPARRMVPLYECYVKSDINDDGILEDIIVSVCEDKLLRVVENPFGRAPFFDLTPFWDSYQVWGKMGLMDIIKDAQDTHTVIWRQMVNALGQSNQWRCVVDQDQIIMDDLINDAQFIRAKKAPTDAFMPVPHPGLNPQNFQFLEYTRGQLEEWTPVTRYNQGLDASSLNKTATGISIIMNAAQQRQEEIVRNFAETGIRELFRFLIQLNQRYIDQPQVIRLKNQPIEVTPDDLDGDFDLSVDAASGVGAVNSKVEVLTRYLSELYPFAMQIGVAGPNQFVHAGRKLLKLMGIEDADKYLLDPVELFMQELQTEQEKQIAALIFQMQGGLPLGGQLGGGVFGGGVPAPQGGQPAGVLQGGGGGQGGFNQQNQQGPVSFLGRGLPAGVQ